MWFFFIYLAAVNGAPVDPRMQSRLHLSPASNITELTNMPCRIDDWPRLPDTAICDKYYVCDARFGYLAAQYCPEGMAFSTGEQECHLMDRVDCSSRPNFHNLLPIFGHEHEHEPDIMAGMNMTLLEMNLAQPNLTGLAVEPMLGPGTGPVAAAGTGTPTGGAAGTAPSTHIHYTTEETEVHPAPSTLTGPTGSSLTFPVPVRISLPENAVLTIPAGTVIYLPPGYSVNFNGTGSGTGMDTGLLGTVQQPGASTGNFRPVHSSVLTNITESIAGPGATPITPPPSTGHAHHGHDDTAGAARPISADMETANAGATGEAGTPYTEEIADTPGTEAVAGTAWSPDSAGALPSISTGAGTSATGAGTDSGPRPISSSPAMEPITGSNASTSALEELASVLENVPIASATGVGTVAASPLHSEQPGHQNATDSTSTNGTTSTSHVPVPPSSTLPDQMSSITAPLTRPSPEAVHHGAGSPDTAAAGTGTFPLSLGASNSSPSHAHAAAGTSTDGQTGQVTSSSAAMAGIPPPGAVNNPPPVASTPVKIYGPPSPADISFPTKGASTASTGGQSFTGLYIMNGMLFNRPMGSSLDTASQDLNSLVQYLQKYTAGSGTGALRSNIPAWPIPSHRLSHPNQRKVTAADCATLNQTRLPDALQCDKYYVCSLQQGLLPYLCPDGLVFDPAVQECRLPQNVDCTQRPDLQPSQSTGVCQRQNGVFLNPDNCQEFFLCAAGSFTTIECPKGLAFSFSEGTCVSPDIAKIPGCEVDQDEIMCASMRNLPAGMTKLFPTDNCRSYIECTGNGKYRRRTCPPSQVFNPKVGFCDDPSRVPECENIHLAQ